MSETDYSYSDPSQPSYPAPAANEGFLSSIQLPFALLTCALAIVMITQTVGVFRQRSTLQDGKIQLADAYAKREALVKQSADLQAKLQAVVMDLLILGKTDDEAKAIIGKYNIQQNLPASAPSP